MKSGINIDKFRGILAVICVFLLPDATDAQSSGGSDGATIGIAVGVSIATSLVTTLITLTIVYLVMKHSRKKDGGDSSTLRRGTNERKSAGSSSIYSHDSETPFIKRSISQDTEMGQVNGGPRYRSGSRTNEKQHSRIMADYVSRWCTENSLSEATVYCLRDKGFRSRAEMDSMRVEDIPRLGLKSVAEECKLREVLNKRLRGSESQSSMLHHQKSTSEDPLPSPTVNDTSAGSSSFDRSTSLTHVDTVDGQVPVGKRLRPRPSMGSLEIIEDQGKKGETVYYINGPGRGRVYAQMIPSGKNGSKTFNGLLSDKGLWEFANMIGAEWPHLATLLRIPKAKQDQIALDYPNNTMVQINEMLRLWRDSAKGSKAEIKGRLHEAFKKVKRADLAEYLLQETIHGSEERVTYNTII